MATTAADVPAPVSSSRRQDPIESLTPRHELSLFAGASGVGKTTLLLQAVAALQRGQPFFGMETDPTVKVGYFAADRTWDAYLQVATSMGVDNDRLSVISLIDSLHIPGVDLTTLHNNPSRILYNGLAWLHQQQCNFIIVDPLILFLGCDVRSYHQVAAGLIAISRWCKLHQVTILGTHHAAKARTDYGYKRPQDRISGSAALLGFSSTQIFLDAPNENDLTYYRLTIVSHTAPMQELQLQRDVTAGGPFVLHSPTSDPVMSRVLSSIPLNSQLPLHTLYQQVGLPAHEVEPQLASLLRLGLIERHRDQVRRLRPA